MPRSKFYLKVQNIDIKPLLKPFETAHFGENCKNNNNNQTVVKMLPFLWASSSQQKITMSFNMQPNWQKIGQSGHPDGVPKFEGSQSKPLDLVCLEVSSGKKSSLKK